jgi:hypothetical protein
MLDSGLLAVILLIIGVVFLLALGPDLVCFLVVLIAKAVAHFFRKPENPSACRKCGNDLTGNTSGVCPECGHPVAGQSKRCDD